MPQNNADINVTQNVSITVRGDFKQTDGTTSNGTIETTISTYGTGTAERFRLSTSDGTSPPNTTLAEAVEYAKDMKDFWTQVWEKLGDLDGSSDGE